MSGIYITQEQKELLLAKVKNNRVLDGDDYEDNEDFVLRKLELEQNFIDELLSQATVLPVEESWEDVDMYEPDNQSQNERTLRFKNGVIIKKQ